MFKDYNSRQVDENSMTVQMCESTFDGYNASLSLLDLVHQTSLHEQDNSMELNKLFEPEDEARPHTLFPNLVSNSCTLSASQHSHSN